ncbi:MAG: DUF4364 family protein [Oscillospiraceae bacterium]|nr:DUF4364 family protein [Oscillospiraceae bacterium]
MPAGLTGENEIKIFILYLLNQINCGICYGDIENITYESGYVGYFDFADIFAKLIDSGDIEKSGSNGENIYNITPRGRAIAENLPHLLPSGSKTKGTSAAARYSDLKKSGAVYSHTLEPDEETGGYIFKCSVKEKNREILNISLLIKDEITAGKTAANFKENPGNIYRGIYAVLSRNADFLF